MYFDLTAIFWLLAIAVVGYYWLLAIRSKELAVSAAERHCEQMQVQFLDQTAFLKKVKFKRNDKGHLGIMREYYFEFTVTGEDRYFGHVFMQGNRLQQVNLDPHRIH
jgi:hypothetical protein